MIDACTHGDDAALVELKPIIRYYADTISRHSWARISRADLMQEGWLAALRARERFDPAQGVKFSTYAKHRIKGAMLDAAETASLRASRETQASHMVRCSVPTVTGAWRLVSCLAALPANHRQVIYWHYIEGRSLREISAALSIHPSRVYQIKASGLMALRRQQPIRLVRRHPDLRVFQQPAAGVMADGGVASRAGWRAAAGGFVEAKGDAGGKHQDRAAAAGLKKRGVQPI